MVEEAHLPHGQVQSDGVGKGLEYLYTLQAHAHSNLRPPTKPHLLQATQLPTSVMH
jgi:hypothetical protein